MRVNWTPEEDAKILAVIGDGGTTRMAARELPHRSFDAVAHRAKSLRREPPRYFGPESRSGQWAYSRDEDIQLARLRNKEFTFSQIAAEMPGRSEDSLRNRWSKLVHEIALVDDNQILPLPAKRASRELVRRQLASGQFNGAAREAWIARHGAAA